MKINHQKYIGWLVQIDEQAFTVVEIGVDQGTLSLVDKDGTKATISFERFRELIHAEMAFDPDEDPRTRNQMLDKRDQLELSFKKGIVAAIRQLRGGGLSWSAAYAQLFLDFSEGSNSLHRVGRFPSLRTVQLWEKADRSKGEAALRPKHKNKGNRTPRFDLLFENITLEIIEDRFGTSDRMTATKLCKLARVIYKEKCKERGIRPGPCGHKSTKAIVRRLPHADIVKLRLGSAEARKQYLLAMKLQQIELPLERVEIDCTTLDLWCVDDEGDPVGRPTVCAAIDCATGIILGLQVAWSAPSSSLVARTMKEIFTPKLDAFFDRFGIQNRFQTVGSPQIIISDQGSENSGPLIASFLRSTAMDWAKCVPGHPDRKPFIERLMLELSRFITQFQGASQTSEIGAQKRTEIAQKEAIHTIHDVEEMLQRWRYDTYAIKQRRRVQNILKTKESPLAAWKSLSKRYFLPPAPPQSQVKEMFMVEAAVRVAEHDGIMYKNIRYASSELRAYLQRIGVRNKVQIRYDPHDIREIAVWDEIALEHFSVRTKRENCPAFSFAEVDNARKKFRTPEIEELETQAILAELQIYEDFKDKNRSGMSKKQRKALQTATTRHREILKLSDNVPGVDPTNAVKPKRAKPSLVMPNNMPQTKQSRKPH